MTGKVPDHAEVSEHGNPARRRRTSRVTHRVKTHSRNGRRAITRSKQCAGSPHGRECGQRIRPGDDTAWTAPDRVRVPEATGRPLLWRRVVDALGHAPDAEKAAAPWREPGRAGLTPEVLVERLETYVESFLEQFDR
ncbi:hypothetical protein ACFXPV_13055 [Streptomyces sp. NPDC059118]|uniref:hypothetical protein n=1 Tax=unclassified Streptomyces TaxID=2593676 RepID=UPI0036D1FF94